MGWKNTCVIKTTSLWRRCLVSHPSFFQFVSWWELLLCHLMRSCDYFRYLVARLFFEIVLDLVGEEKLCQLLQKLLLHAGCTLYYVTGLRVLGHWRNWHLIMLPSFENVCSDNREVKRCTATAGDVSQYYQQYYQQQCRAALVIYHCLGTHLFFFLILILI